MIQPKAVLLLLTNFRKDVPAVKFVDITHLGDPGFYISSELSTADMI